jgi:ATP adenylyltransferase/5',5'''-P-1,P-4-tetraphosphate phosphorylase II
MVLTKEWMILIPRWTNDSEDVGANACGMMGLPMMSEETQEKWIDVGPAKLLKAWCTG